MKKTRLICVGACAIDNILTVPHFPGEDSKLRATSFTKRRGGNTPNTLEVLKQLIDNEHEDFRSKAVDQDVSAWNTVPELFLIATLPARSSTQSVFIASSFNNSGPSHITSSEEVAKSPDDSSPNVQVELSRCIYREEFSEPISSYIISSQSTSSRTIINNNVLPEMTFEEFVSQTHDLCSLPVSPESQLWFHFEGRIADTTLQCIRYLRNRHASHLHNSESSAVPSLKISVELEKPGREGLQDLAHDADIVFYSKAWARGEGYQTAAQCLTEQANILFSGDGDAKTNGKILICTWGEHGASALVWPSHRSHSIPLDGVPAEESSIIHSPAYIATDKPIVDSTGAGDTFIAGVLFGLICRSSEGQAVPDHDTWSLKQTLDFASGLASRKILQDGFSGLGLLSRDLRKIVDRGRE